MELVQQNKTPLHSRKKKKKEEEEELIIHFLFWFKVEHTLGHGKFQLARNSDVFLTFYMVCKKENSSESG